MIAVININVVEVVILIELVITGGESRAIQTRISLLFPGNFDDRHKTGLIRIDVDDQMALPIHKFIRQHEFIKMINQRYPLPSLNGELTCLVYLCKSVLEYWCNANISIQFQRSPVVQSGPVTAPQFTD